MSRSSDEPPRGRPPLGTPAPTQRTPNGYPPVAQPSLPAPPPPRESRAPASFDLEPTPLRSRRAATDISPPVDPLQDAYREVMTGAPSAAQQRQVEQHVRAQSPAAPVAIPPPPMPTPRREMEEEDLRADNRRGTAKESGGTPIVPPRSVTGKSLTLVIAIMCFLACLTAGAVYLMNQSARAWLKDIASEVTVQVEARENVRDLDREVGRVRQMLEKQPGIAKVRPFSPEENAKLLEPWLGQADLSRSSTFQLPIPRLIALEIDRLNPPNFEALRSALAKDFKGVTLDDHRHWQQQIRTVTRSFALGGLAILMLVGAATTAIIVSATRSALSANKDIVEVLHFVGATDRFIAREFAGHFLRLGVRAGIVGAGAAMLVFFALPFVMEMIGGGTVTMAELRRLIGAGTLDLQGYAWLLVVVVVVAGLCMFTSRIGVYRMLHAGSEGGNVGAARKP